VIVVPIFLFIIVMSDADVAGKVTETEMVGPVPSGFSVVVALATVNAFADTP
jgi:hypothetical protein